MRSLHVLYFSKLAFVIQLLDEKKLTAVDNSFGHHIFQTSLIDKIYNLLALLNRGRHGNGAHNVLPRFESFDGHPCVIGNRRIDMNEVDFVVS